MTEAPLTITDAVILAILLGSAFLALMRGLLREALAVSAWLLSVMLTYAVYAVTGPWLRPAIGGSWIVHAILVLGFFIGLVVLFTLANRNIRNRLQGDSPATWDQVGGFLFGLGRGVLLVAVLFHAYVLTFGERLIPDWFVQARLFPVVTAASSVVKEVTQTGREVLDAHNPAPFTTGPARSGTQGRDLSGDGPVRPVRAPEAARRGDGTAQDEKPRSESAQPRGQGDEPASGRDGTSQIPNGDDPAGYSKGERKAIDELVRNRLDSR